MNVVLDSYGLLGAIGCHRDVFAGIDALVKKQATALLTAQLKHKSLDLHVFRAIVAAVGTETFELFLDTADDKLMKAIAKKVDQHAAVSKSNDDNQLWSHLINLAATNPQFHANSLRALAEELTRAHQLELPFLVLHPGAHLGAGEEAGLDKIVASIDRVFARIPKVKDSR